MPLRSIFSFASPRIGPVITQISLNAFAHLFTSKISNDLKDKNYLVLSGGEKQKINLIIQTSIRDMLCQYLDFHSNILVLDEITDSLDSIGCDKILSLIAKRLIDVESIFIISHRARELEIPYDSEITIIKDESGISRIKQ